MIKFWRDIRGAVLVEATLVLPMFLLVALGTVDVAFTLYNFALANKAVYTGAHAAIVSDPVASEVASPTWNSSKLGDPCFDGTNTNCPSVNITCTAISTTTGTCTDGGTSYTFDAAAFQKIFSTMQVAMACNNPAACQLQPQNVKINYATNQLGFVGQPSGLSVNVTVSVQCMTHPLFFLRGLMGWVFPNVCGQPAAGWRIPSYATTLSSEDMLTN